MQRKHDRTTNSAGTRFRDSLLTFLRRSVPRIGLIALLTAAAAALGCGASQEFGLGSLSAKEDPFAYWFEEPASAGPRELQNWIDPGMHTARFRVTWRADEPRPQLSLIRPDGVMIANQEFDHYGIKVRETAGKHMEKVDGRMRPLTITTIEISDPALGLWQLRINDGVEYESEEITVEIPNEYDNELQTASRLVYHPERGLTRVIEVSLGPFKDGSRPQLSEIHIPARCLVGPDLGDLTFRDDGQGWDRQAGDGVFTHENDRMTKSLLGFDKYCLLKVMMIGKADGHAFTRHSMGQIDLLSCRDFKLEPGQAYEIEERVNNSWALRESIHKVHLGERIPTSQARRFYVHAITSRGEVLVSTTEGVTSMGYRIPLDLENTLCKDVRIGRFKGDLPPEMTAPLEDHRLAVEARIMDTSGQPVEADVEVWWIPDGQRTKQYKASAVSEFEIEREGQGMTVLFTKEGYLPVCLGLPKGSDHVCSDLSVVLRKEGHDAPLPMAKPGSKRAPCELKNLAAISDPNLRDRFCGMPHKTNTFHIGR